MRTTLLRVALFQKLLLISPVKCILLRDAFRNISKKMIWDLLKLLFFQYFRALYGGGGAGVHLNLTNLSEADILCEERNHRGSWQVKMAHKKNHLVES